MAGRTVEVALIASTSQYNDAMARAATVSEETGKRIGAAGLAGGNAFGAGIEKGTSKVGNLFEKLGGSLGNWGIPFSGNLEKIGKDFQNVETKGKAFGEAMSAVGAVGIAALVGIGAESIHVADNFEKAQSQLETAVKNSGNSWSAYSKQIDAAYNSAAKLGFENNDVASALQELTTATKSPKTALSDIGLAEDIARMKGISLADAAQGLVKIYGGSVYQLQQWGINLDIGSDKLKSIQSAEEAVQSATLRLHTVQGEMNDGQLQGIQANSDLSSAQMALRNATLNLTESQKALPDIMATLQQRTQGAAAAFGKTLPGEMKTAEAEIHNLGVAFGEFLVPKIDAALAELSKVVGWFEKNKDAAELAAGAIAVTLGGAITFFVGSKVVSFVNGIGKMVSALEGWVVKSVATAQESGAADKTYLAALQADTAQLEATYAARTGAATTSASEIEASYGGIEAANVGLRSSFVATGLAAAAALAPVIAALATVAAGYKLWQDLKGGQGISGIAPTGNLKTAESEISKSSGGIVNGSALAQQAQIEVDNFNKNAGKTQIVGSQVPNFGNTFQGLVPKAKSPGSTIPKLTGNTNPTGGAPITTITPADALLEDQAKRLTGILQRALGGGTSFSQQGRTIAGLTAATSPSNAAQAASLESSLNATNNPTLVALAQSIETTWASATNKITTIIDGDTTKGQSELAKLQGAQSSTSFASLRNAVTGVAVTGYNQLVAELTSVHSKKLDGLIASLKSTWAATNAAFQAVTANLAAYASADALAAATAGVTGGTTAASNAGQAATGLAGLQSQQVVNNLNNAATSINDAAKLQADAASLQVLAIQAQTTAVTDASNAQVAAITDQTQIQVDTLGERGLYGLALQAQLAKVALDQQKATDDQSIAAAQAHLDSVTAQTNQVVALAQQKSDSAQQQADQAIAAAQSTADSDAIRNSVSVAAAQAQADAAATQVAINEAAAQAHVDAVQFGTQQQQAQAQAAQYLANQQGAATNAASQANLTAVTAAANLSNTNDQDAYNQTQSYWTQQLAYVQQQLSSAQNDASVQQALASQSLATLQSSSAIAEAKLTSIYNVDQEIASTQFAGGYVVNVYAQPGDGPQEYVSALGWALRTQPS